MKRWINVIDELDRTNSAWNTWEHTGKTKLIEKISIINTGRNRK